MLTSKPERSQRISRRIDLFSRLTPRPVSCHLAVLGGRPIRTGHGPVCTGIQGFPVWRRGSDPSRVPLAQISRHSSMRRGESVQAVIGGRQALPAGSLILIPDDRGVML